MRSNLWLISNFWTALCCLAYLGDRRGATRHHHRRRHHRRRSHHHSQLHDAESYCLTSTAQAASAQTAGKQAGSGQGSTTQQTKVSFGIGYLPFSKTSMNVGCLCYAVTGVSTMDTSPACAADMCCTLRAHKTIKHHRHDGTNESLDVMHCTEGSLLLPARQMLRTSLLTAARDLRRGGMVLPPP